MPTLPASAARPPNEAKAERILLVVAFLIFWFCRSNFYDGDGLKYAVWEPGGMSWFSSSNHVLTPLWLKLWWALIGWAVPDDFDSQVRATQVFNHLCGAGCVYLVARIVRKSGGIPFAGIAAGGVLLGTWAFLYHASHFSEPVIGVLWMLLSWDLLAGADAPDRKRVVFSALSYVIAAASYQTCFFAAPALLLAVRTVPGAFLWSGVAALAGLVVFVGAAVAGGAHDVTSVMLYAKGPLELRGRGVYWGVLKPERIFQALLGAIHMVLGLYRQLEWAGFRRSFAELAGPARVFLLAKVVIASCGFIWIAIRAWSLRRAPAFRIVALLVAPSLFLIAYWDPYYLKLWIAPATALAVLVGLGIRRGGVRPVVAAAALLLAINYGYGVIREQSDENLQAKTTRVVEETVGPKDLLIGDAWSVLSRYFSKHANDRLLYSVTSAGDDPGLARLRDRVARTRADGGRVFLYGILDASDRDWSESVGLIGGLPREVRDQWMQRSRLVWRGRDKGVLGDMYELVGDWP